MEIYEIANLAILGLILLLALIGGLKGLSRGICRGTVRFVTIILSIILSFFLARLVGARAFAWLEGMTVEELIAFLVQNGVVADAESLGILTYFDTVTIEYILAIPVGIIIIPLIFTLLFPIISGLMLIVHAIFSGILGFTKKKNNIVTRLLGLALGAAQGAIVAAVLLVPAIGIVNTLGSAVDVARENENKSDTETSLVEVYDSAVKPIADGVAFKTVSTFGGNLIYENLAKVKLEGERVNVAEQTGVIVKIVGYTGELGELDLGNLTPENKQAINAIIDTIESSNYFSPLLANVAKGFSKYALEGDTVSSIEEPLGTLVKDILSIFETSGKENICQDLDTFIELIYLLSDEGVLSGVSGGEGAEGGESSGDMVEILTKADENGKTVVSRAIDILNSNERTKFIVTSLTKIALSSMTQQMGATKEETEQLYDSVKTGLSDVVSINKEDFETHEEYKDAVAESLNSTLIENDIQLPTETVEELADHVIENYGDMDASELTDEQVTSIILQYYDMYASEIE